jgi:epoxyqueuosine reductase
MTPPQLTAALKEEARRLGFQLAGVAPAMPAPGIERFRLWLTDGFAGGMHYLAGRAPAYEHPRHVLEGVRSILMLGTAYRTAEPTEPAPGEGRVSRYAWGSDYHDLIHWRLKRLEELHQQLAPAAAVRGVVDTAPLLEREFAQLAGLGWVGKNTLLLNRHYGSWFFLAALLSSEPLVPDGPMDREFCGECRRCLDACPTGALVEPYRLDARRCISYLTIELRDHIPAEFRPAMGDRLFGCDACQEVCPWNRRAACSTEPALRPDERMNPIELAPLFELDDEAFRRRFRHSPLWRAKRRGVLRNAAIVLGNQADAEAVRALLRALNDDEPLVRAAAAWAMGRCGGPEARRALRERLAVEPDATARAEMETPEKA